jgi:hypothetical protein
MILLCRRMLAQPAQRTARVREEQTMPQIAIDPALAATLPLAA